jgi:hypothetical protein
MYANFQKDPFTYVEETASTSFGDKYYYNSVHLLVSDRFKYVAGLN